MDKRDSVKTGDILLFSGNSPTGILLKTFVSSEWNHSGIAVRFITVPDPNNSNRLIKTISLTEEGELYILETNDGPKKDAILGHETNGARFVKADYAFRKYNKIAVRKLQDVFRTDELADLTMDFVNKYKINPFPNGKLPFVSVWLGIQIGYKGMGPDEMFCSQLTSRYYSHSIGPQYERITGNILDGKLSTLFGTESPVTEDMFTPGHYAYVNAPNASIFTGPEELIFTSYADLLYVILQPFLIILVIIVIIWMTLPRKKLPVL